MANCCWATIDEGADDLVITASTRLDPSKKYGRIVIRASDIVIDGQGALLAGSDAPGNERKGIAIEARDVHRVKLLNVRARGWETGLHLQDCSQWTVESCDFSDNFHDPEFGWGENGRRGGMVLVRTSRSSFRNNQAHRVWDACVLVESSENVFEKNDFSHTSNTCLKLWQASRNTFLENDFSYGIRKKPNEVHARDSTGVLIESGSNDNRFLGNNCTYGGDGIFIRVLNRWCSTGNYFEGNDCSYANNNGFECWAPRNTFVRNRANHCSYGFWLGGSDQTVLDGNEASYNGLPDGHHNSPHLPDAGHAGIVFMFGPSSHIVARGNRCQGNNGAGIALVGDQASKGEKWRAYHWLIEENNLLQNRWGVFANYADWIELNRNYLSENSLSAVECSTAVTRLVERNRCESPIAELKPRLSHLQIAAPSQASVNQSVTMSLGPLAASDARIVWDLGDGSQATGERVTHTYSQAGFYRVGVNALSDKQSQLGWLDLYVTDDLPEVADNPTSWSFESAAGLNCTFQRDTQYKLVGNDSLLINVDPYHGGLVRMQSALADTALDTTKQRELVFWLKANNPNLPGWQSNNPEIILSSKDGEKCSIKPKKDLLSQPTYNEAREGWQMIVVPLQSHADWDLQGSIPNRLTQLSIGLDSWDAGPLQIWIDGIVIR